MRWLAIIFVLTLINQSHTFQCSNVAFLRRPQPLIASESFRFRNRITTPSAFCMSLNLDFAGSIFEIANSASHAIEPVVHEHFEKAKIVFTNPILRAAVGTETGWGLILVLGLVTVGQTFELAKETLIKKLPRRLEPVINAIIVELATVGVVALLIAAIHTKGEEGIIQQLSANFLGDPENMMEQLEVLDKSLAALSVTFFFGCAFVLTAVSNQFDEWSTTFRREILALMERDLEQTDALFDPAYSPPPFPTPGSPSPSSSASFPSSSSTSAPKASAYRRGTVTLARAAKKPGASGDAAAGVASWSPAGWGLLEDEKERCREFTMLRQRFIQQANLLGGWALPDDFKFGEYLSLVAASRLREIVTLEAWEQFGLWIFIFTGFVGIESVASEVSLTTSVASGVSAESLLVSVPTLFCVSQLFLGGVVAFNLAFTDIVKRQLVPQPPPVSGEVDTTSIVELASPPYAVSAGEGSADWAATAAAAAAASSGSGIEAAEEERQRQRQTLREAHVELLAAPLWGSGEESVERMASSLKLVLFASVISLACGAPTVGVALWVVSPVLAAAAFAPAVLGLLTTPKAFVNYLFCTATEELRDDRLVGRVLARQREEKFLLGLETLCQLSLLLDQSSQLASARRRSRSAVDKQWATILRTLPPAVTLDLRALFSSADEDGGGTLGREETRKLCRSLRRDLSEEAFEAIFRYMDVSGDGRVNFKEFATAFLPIATAAGAEQRGEDDDGFSLDEMIRLSDGNGDGLVTREEFRSSVFGRSLSPDKADRLFSSLAKFGDHGEHNGHEDGHHSQHESHESVTLEQFKIAVLTNKLFEFFDSDGSGEIDEEEMLALVSIDRSLLDKTGVKALMSGISEEAFNKGRLSKEQFASYLAARGVRLAGVRR